jgi:hypothetical protein
MSGFEPAMVERELQKNQSHMELGTLGTERVNHPVGTGSNHTDKAGDYIIIATFTTKAIFPEFPNLVVQK